MEYSLDKYHWDKLRVGQICSATEKPGEGYENIKVPLEKLCADTNLCTAEDKSRLQSISQKADAAISGAKEAPPFATESLDPAENAGKEDRSLKDLQLQE